MAAGADDDAVHQVDRRRGELRRDHLGLVVGGEGAVRAEVAGEEDEVVALAEQRVAQVVRIPRPGPRIGHARLVELLWRDVGVGDQLVDRGGQASVELVTHGIGRIGQEVVAGDEAGARGHDAVGGDVGVDHPGDLGRGLHQAADREVGDREGGRADVDRRAGAVRVLAQDVVTAQARLGDRVALRRREVAGLLPEQALVGVAEERDDGVAAEDRHVAQRLGRIGFRRGAIRVDDALDLLGDEVLRERTATVRRGIGLGPELLDPRVRRRGR